MSALLILIVVLLLFGWGGGYWYGPTNIRGNNAVHVLLVIALLILVLSALGVVRIR